MGRAVFVLLLCLGATAALKADEDEYTSALDARAALKQEKRQTKDEKKGLYDLCSRWLGTLYILCEERDRQSLLHKGDVRYETMIATVRSRVVQLMSDLGILENRLIQERFLYRRIKQHVAVLDVKKDQGTLKVKDPEDMDDDDDAGGEEESSTGAQS